MSYKDFLKERINQLELQIANEQGQKDALKKELQDLMRQEFEEDLREETDKPTLLKG